MKKTLHLLVSMALLFVLYACIPGQKITITFNTNGGTDLAPIVLEGDSVLEVPNNPSKEGYDFGGWFLDDVTFNNPFNPNDLEKYGNTFTVYAKWIIIDTPLTIQLKAIYQMAVDSNTFTGTYEEWLESVRGPQGNPGKEVSFQVSEGYIQWQYVGDSTWTNLIELTSLVGPAGQDGTNGKEVTYRVSEGYIQWQYLGDSTWTNLVALSTLTGAAGKDGLDAREVALRLFEDYIQWQYVGESEWKNLIEVATLRGDNGSDGREVTLKVEDDILMWKYEDETIWKSLIDMNSLKGMSAYEIYLLYYPEYTGTEKEWIDDLVNGELGEREQLTITFLYHDTENTTEIIKVEKFDKIPKPEVPVKEGYDFKGWYVDNEKWSFIGFIATEDITLQAVWEIVAYHVEYELNGGTASMEYQTTYTVESPLILLPPTQQNASFMGWYRNEQLTVPYVSIQEIGDLKLYTKWDYYPEITYENSSYRTGTEIDLYENVFAYDIEDGDITSSIDVIFSNLDMNKPGKYIVIYEVIDHAGNRTITDREITIDPYTTFANYQNGVDLSLLSPEDRDILFSAAENYLLENVYAGVPLYNGTIRAMYSSRVQLFSSIYNGVLGYGTQFSQFTQDDSNVIMYGNTFGNVGEYTWRAAYSIEPISLNQWTEDYSSASDFIKLFTGSLYDFHFDETKTGYEILPSLAAAEPIPLNPTIINGKAYAKTWQIQVRDGLTWKYHPNTDLSGMSSGHQVINAEDFLWTWRYALEQRWFRATTGGGDFVTSAVKGAADYLSGVVSIDDVGLRLAAGKANTLEIEYINEKSAFDVKYQFSSTSMSPVNRQLLEKLGATYYGTSPQTVPSSGVYYFETWTPGQLLVFKKNTLHPQSSMYFYTGQQFRYMRASDLIFQEFLEGKLDSASVPASRVSEFASDPRVKVAPAATTWRMVINAFGTVENRDAYMEANPGVHLTSTFVPEPILMYKEMRQALYFGFDRYEAAVNVVKTYLPAYTLFTNTYFLDGESGMSVRTLPAGAAILEKYGQGSYGFQPDDAVVLFEQAVAKAIAEGHYQKGTASNYTVIDLTLTYASSGNTAAQAMVAQIKEQYENLLIDNTNFVRIQIIVNDVAFPGNYYDFMMKANTDLGIGGISGSLLDAPGFLGMFTDDNRSGFTLDWGIDTSTPNITVEYHNIDGVFVSEIWSYNALITALNGKTYVRDGVEQKAWTNVEDLISAYLDVAGEKLATVAADTQGLAGYILGNLDDLANQLNVDSVEAYVAVTELGKSYLFIVKKTGLDYELHQQLALATNARDAIAAHNSDYTLNGISENPLTLEELNAIPYISSTYGSFSSLNDVWTSTNVPFGVQAFVYSTQWNTYENDAYVVIKVGAYYVGWAWL